MLAQLLFSKLTPCQNQSSPIHYSRLTIVCACWQCSVFIKWQISSTERCERVRWRKHVDGDVCLKGVHVKVGDRSEGYLESKLVHGMDFIEVIHDEVEKRGTGSRRTVVLSCLVDFSFCHLCLFYLKHTHTHNNAKINALLHVNISLTIILVIKKYFCLFLIFF